MHLFTHFIFFFGKSEILSLLESEYSKVTESLFLNFASTHPLPTFGYSFGVPLNALFLGVPFSNLSLKGT